MRKFFIAVFVATLMFGSVPAVFAAVDCTKENWIDQAGDWFATRGKNGIEKDNVLAQRKAERIAKCTKREAEKAAKQAQKSTGDMKKKLGF